MNKKDRYKLLFIFNKALNWNRLDSEEINWLFDTYPELLVEDEE